MSSSTYFILSTWVALALQFLRLSIDLIQVASSSTSDTPAPKLDNGSFSTSSCSAAALSKSNTSRSEDAEIGTRTASTAINGNGKETYGSVADAESQTLLHDKENYLNQKLSCSAFGCSHERLIAQVQIIYTMILALLAILGWGIVQVQGSSTIEGGAPGYLWWAALWTALEAILSRRDERRIRYGIVQQILRRVDTVFFVVSAGSAGLQHWAIALVTLIVLTALYDDWHSVKIHKATMETLKANGGNVTDKESQTKSMSLQGMATLLRPYFWPDAVNATAFWNRVRAISTWFFLVASKACNLTAPLMVGYASTCLAHQDFGNAIRYSIFYAVLIFFGVLFDECKSLVYLKVSSVAFVQISSQTFDHLHHLSLDWHLRKKLGEVIRGVDRGIVACDQVMQYLFLWLVPALGECLVVTIIFATYFKYLPLALAVFSFVFVYIVWTILVTLWRKKYRKAVATSDNGRRFARVLAYPRMMCAHMSHSVLNVSC